MSDNRPSISLEVIEGPHKGKSFTLSGHDTFVVGRSSDAHFRLSASDRYFSRVHFMIEVNPPKCRLVDMGSRNGTYVNGKRVSLVDLCDGDQIRAGHTMLQVVFHEGFAAEPELVALPRELLAELASAPATQEPEPTLAGTCRVCAALVEVSDSPRFLASPWPLCDGCVEELRRQPQTIPGYQVIRRLGKGGMGVVSLALRIADGGVVAVKTIAPAVPATQADYERFLREAEILRRLQHPHIVAFHEMGEAQGRLFFVMEHVRGTDAQEFLQSEGPLPPQQAIPLICQVLEALEYAHGLGFVHRDIKPANILIQKAEGGRQKAEKTDSAFCLPPSAFCAKVADFGLARVYQASHLSGLTLQGDVGGTAGFIAPEQIMSFRDAKPAADQYAAAATLYTLLTGKFLHDMPDRFHDQILKILHEEPVPVCTRRPDLPAELGAVIHRALEKRPENRFSDVNALRKALLDLPH